MAYRDELAAALARAEAAEHEAEILRERLDRHWMRAAIYAVVVLEPGFRVYEAFNPLDLYRHGLFNHTNIGRPCAVPLELCVVPPGGGDAIFVATHAWIECGHLDEVDALRGGTLSVRIDGRYALRETLGYFPPRFELPYSPENALTYRHCVEVRLELGREVTRPAQIMVVLGSARGRYVFLPDEDVIDAECEVVDDQARAKEEA